jgi:hypothetical protein
VIDSGKKEEVKHVPEVDKKDGTKTLIAVEAPKADDKA